MHFNWNMNVRSEQHQKVHYLDKQMEKSLSLPSQTHNDFLTTLMQQDVLLNKGM